MTRNYKEILVRRLKFRAVVRQRGRTEKSRTYKGTTATGVSIGPFGDRRKRKRNKEEKTFGQNWESQ